MFYFTRLSFYSHCLCKHVSGLPYTYRPYKLVVLAGQTFCNSRPNTFFTRINFLANRKSGKFVLYMLNNHRQLGVITFKEIKPVNEVNSTKINIAQSDPRNRDTITAADLSATNLNETGVLEPCEEDVSDIAPFVSPSYNLAAYANKSPTLQQLVKMGVNLHKLETRKGAAEAILKLDFDKDMKMHLRFLHDFGVPAEEFGSFVTRNPFIFEQSLDDLEVRINYLEAKKFPPEGIARIITKNPMWLNFSTIQIDKSLGFFQRTFKLSGDEVRQVAIKRPRLITTDYRKILESVFAVKEDMGFNELEAKALLLKKPKLFNLPTQILKERFDYVHNIMEIAHEQICQTPEILFFRNFIFQHRHEFLKALGKAQYNPKQPGYISLDTLVHGSDVDFCRNVAKTSIETYNSFLKTV